MSSRLKLAGIVLLASFALAACGGGGGGTATMPTGPTQAELDAAKIAELQGQINALREQLGLGPDGNLSNSIAELQQQADDLAERIQDEKDAAAEKMRMEAAARGKAMYAALAGNATAGTTALNNIDTATTPISIGSAGLVIDAAAGAGSLADATDPGSVTLKAGDSAGSLDGWAGTNYAHTDPNTKIENAAVVYNNKGPGRSRSFTDLGYVVQTVTSGDNIKGYVTLDESDADTLGRIMATAFLHSGTQNHSIPDRSDAVYFRGTYDGAPGEYRCAGTCSTTNDGSGSPSAIAGEWHFKPDAGANAMAHQPDDTYLYYGWWVSKDKDGAPTAASAFTGVMLPTGGTAPVANLTGVTGSAEYSGHAAGKFALNHPADGSGDGGHFTADVTLSAKFSGTGAGISGTVDNFMANDQSVPWSVALHRADWNTDLTTGNFATPDTDDTATTADETMGTTWSIDGNSAARSGTWSGTMYDEMPGNAPTGDGSNIPTTVTGTFYSEFGDQGRMVGAFGADD